MQTKHRIFDELAKLAMSGAGIASQVRQDSEGYFKKKCEEIFAKADFVTREEFDVLKEMLVQARLTETKLEERIEALEAQLKKRK
jgi:BMFP domain-containing protein YqiC